MPSDPAFTTEFNKQSHDLKRKKGELEKISQVITKKEELIKDENQEKQRLHNLKVQRRKLDVRLKLGDSWDMARRMFGLPQKSTNNDKDFFQLLDSYRTTNPDNSTYMEALRLEITRIVAGFDQLLDEMVIFIYCQREGSFKVSLNLFENIMLVFRRFNDWLSVFVKLSVSICHQYLSSGYGVTTGRQHLMKISI